MLGSLLPIAKVTLRGPETIIPAPKAYLET